MSAIVEVPLLWVSGRAMRGCLTSAWCQKQTRRVVIVKQPASWWSRASLSVDHGKLFAAIEGEVHDQLRRLADDKLEETAGDSR
jgi:hypothetical protein